MISNSLKMQIYASVPVSISDISSPPSKKLFETSLIIVVSDDSIWAEHRVDICGYLD
jgi:hypothetical protein